MNIEKLTTEQLAAITDDELNKLIDLECASRGIPLFLGEPRSLPDPPAKPSTKVYSISGVLCYNKEHANRILDAINSESRPETTYSYEQGISGRILTGDHDDRELSVTEEFLYTEAQVALNKTQMMTYAEAKKEHEAQRSKIRKSEIERTKVWEEFYRARDRAIQEIEASTVMERRFEQYVALAKGDAQSALQFMIKADNLHPSWRPKNYNQFVQAHTAIESLVSVPAVADESDPF